MTRQLWTVVTQIWVVPASAANDQSLARIVPRYRTRRHFDDQSAAHRYATLVHEQARQANGPLAIAE